MLDAMRNRRAIAATDASMVENNIAAHWIIINHHNEREIEGGTQSKRWSEGTTPAGEGIGLLNLMQNIKRKVAGVDQGEMIIYSDNKHVLKEYCKDINKASDCTKEAGGVIEHVR